MPLLQLIAPSSDEAELTTVRNSDRRASVEIPDAMFLSTADLVGVGARAAEAGFHLAKAELRRHSGAEYPTDEALAEQLAESIRWARHRASAPSTLEVPSLAELLDIQLAHLILQSITLVDEATGRRLTLSRTGTIGTPGGAQTMGLVRRMLQLVAAARRA